ncbi:MAG: methyltransferase family protein [Thermoguttaceae bacterium]
MNNTTMPCNPVRTENHSRIAFLLDLAERMAISALYIWLVFRIVGGDGVPWSIPNLILLFSEGLVLLLILIRRTASHISRRPGDWILAFSATMLPLLVYPAPDRALLPPSIAAMIMLVGLVVQIHAKLVLGRSLGCVPANRGLKLFGPYRYVRHPMYAGYLLTHVAFLLMNPTIWNVGVYLTCYIFQIPRLLAEEQLLGKDSSYVEYMATVRYRLIPGVF